MTAPESSKSVITPVIVIISLFAVGAVAAVMSGAVPNPFKTAEQEASSSHTTSGSAASAAAAKPRVVAKAPPAVCRECGVVESIESFTEKGQASGGGAVAGGLLGGVIGHQVGKGRGKDLATVAGVVGGAIAGHEIEKNVKKVTRYRIGLRMDGGNRQQMTLDAANGVNVGDKVKIVDGMLMRN